MQASPQSSNAVEQLSREQRLNLLRSRSWEIEAAQVDGTVHLDGKLQEPAWSVARPVTDLYQGERNEGLPATERTEIRVLYDHANLYIGIRCFDSRPSLIRARGVFRDEWAGSDDLLLVMIDAAHDHRSAMQFVTNANGLVQDALQLGESTATRDGNVDMVWDARASRTPSGFEVEMVIPFKTLRFTSPADDDEVIFGIGFKRNIPRKNEDVIWPFVSNDSSWYRPAELGHVRGLRGVRAGRRLEIRPYVLAAVDRDVAARHADPRRDTGVDVKWGVGRNLTADFSLNTDFAQEEVDVQQTNFTRFSLFFPERRQFFLEGAQTFQFGIPQEAQLVFTRRIGLSEDGSPVPITAGARLSGRQGRTSIGAMSIQTRETPSSAAENFSVLRLRRDLFDRSSVGMLISNRQEGGRFNRVMGIDASFLFWQVWSVEGFVARSADSGHVDGGAVFGQFAYDTDRAGLSYRYLDLGHDFHTGVGFLRRPDSRQHATEVRYSPRPAVRWIRQMHFRGFFDYITNQARMLESRRRGTQADAAFESGDVLTVTYTDRFEWLAQPFRLRPETAVPAGTYRFASLGASLRTYNRRHVRVQLSVDSGAFWGGSRETVSMNAEYRLNKHLALNGSYEYNWVEISGGRLATYLLSSRTQVAFGRDLALLSLLQWNAETRQLSSNVRLNWIPKPGTDLFVVYNELDERTGGLSLRNRSLAIKLNYLFAF